MTKMNQPHDECDQREKSMYLPQCESDACGIGFIAHVKGEKSHQIVLDALTMLENMEHRGAIGSDPETGDGAGILIQVPDKFFRKKLKLIGLELPAFGEYGVGMIYFPEDVKEREECRRLLNINLSELGFELIGYRDVPSVSNAVGETARKTEPKGEQIFVKHKDGLTGMDLERKLFVLRQYSAHTINKMVLNNNQSFYFTSFSYKTLVYKGQFRTHQTRKYYTDLLDEDLESAIALIHSRFSTNTFPKWRLAQPFRYIAHNGEINTIKGNMNWMRSNEKFLECTKFTHEDMIKLRPVMDETNSDSGNLDSMVEMLVMGGRSLPHTLMMLLPEAWQKSRKMDDDKKAFYQYHASIMEPWDGPASICFTDGNIVGATLDRNGLRPSRLILTNDDRIIVSSEVGALPIAPEKIVRKWRVQPGKMIYVDLEKGKIVFDKEIKAEISKRADYRSWLDMNQLHIDNIPEQPSLKYDTENLLSRQQAFGFSQEDVKFIITSMAEEGKEPIGSMGSDVPLAILSNQSRHLSNYFQQQFAQVSNPPIDPIRERIVMSLRCSVGKLYNLLSETPLHCKQIVFDQPVLTNEQLYKLQNYHDTNFRIKVLDAVYSASGEPGELEKALNLMCEVVDKAIIENGYNVIIISDKKIDTDHAPIPSLLAVGAIHHHLIENGLRVRVGLIVEAGDVRETHHFATLIGYGANAINPYMAFDTIVSLEANKLSPKNLTNEIAFKNYIAAIGNGLLKIFSKMGISTLQSYQGAQIFESIGLSNDVINKCFKGTVSRLGGIGFEGVSYEVLVRHQLAFPKQAGLKPRLDEGGIYQWKQKGEHHLFNPTTIRLLQQAARTKSQEVYNEYAKEINNQSEKAVTIRSLFEFKKRKSIPLSEVEPIENIFKRFATGAMSFGSISHEAHSTLAIAMNRIGGKSNCGEGGEDEMRFEPLPNGDSMRSAIKQVASGRFGVTSYYLSEADEIQIKMAQGAKPGEGGQLPGYKVNEWIGKVRHSTPGVGLISPPPHHDIYSIEDLAQLIYDLKNANRKARINVKLVSKAGVGTIAAGVAKAHADVVLISGFDGGTGASPISSVQHTGTSWELGLSETHQTLVKNKLRDRITLQTDGQLRTGRDLAIATLLGAEEWGIATAGLIVMGCVMMRKCHSNTCPVGVATQDKELRKLFTGKPEHVVNFFTFLAEDLRQIMAELGFRTINEMVGQTDVLRLREDIEHWKIRSLDLSPILYKEKASKDVGLYKKTEQDHGIDKFFDWKLIKLAKAALEKGEKVYGEFDLVNTDRAVGTLLSNEISKKYKSAGLPEDTINLKFRGSAGQSYAAFSAKGITFELEGEANDYFGKGLSGSKLIVYPDRKSTYDAAENMIIGNVAFYGATSGEAYINGIAGERFCVRNSGVTAVVEGVGRHACEYMTRGTVIILGNIGSNFGAGMSGGVAYVYDIDGTFDKYKNYELDDCEGIDMEDEELLRDYISKHQKYTKSKRAKHILDNWDNAMLKFIKVFPKEYKLALENQKKEGYVPEKGILASQI
ncbi:glutamate synthase large subunit [Ancylomarina sp. 16SWW S1-10-2]|uniref:glutamate synthase large subunit n=1 Tax=Ancylomarina sp. 16SWW S1-10-2 TaxID=2499681 RepID=UPI001E61B777|nr:glutamate synthase large subunit [Ancylomarina sp. 16SWW S1-10-2]